MMGLDARKLRTTERIPACADPGIFFRGRMAQGGTLIFSYIRRLGPLFWAQNFEFQYFWGFQKNKYFHKIGLDLYLGVISMDFRVFFLRSWYRMGIFFWVAKISIIFLGCLKFLIFFWSEG